MIASSLPRDEAEDVVQETFLRVEVALRAAPTLALGFTLLRHVFANAFIVSGLASRPKLSHSKSGHHLETTQWVSLEKMPIRR
jgi:DNA-directed RNA polymerase specialized sigma24 family protein